MYSTHTHAHARALTMVLACAHLAIIAAMGTYFTPAIAAAIREVMR